MSKESKHLPVVVENLNAVALFVNGDIDKLLDKIEKEADSYVTDPTTKKGRDEIASIGYKIARSKTILDDLGKDEVAGIKEKSKKIDVKRKHARDRLDILKGRILKPKLDYEKAEKEKKEAEELALQISEAQEEALREHKLYLREQWLKAKQARIQKEEDERKAKETEAQAKKERLAREEEIRKNAAAEAEKKAKEEAERKENERLADEARKKKEEEARTADVKHRQEVEEVILDALLLYGLHNEDALNLIKHISGGAIPGLSIKY